ncbi:MAG: hypothetical protein M3007_00890 [Candidatus Eremiobacteraeota bacterium]|nr:hypothetical protein [Candidatus Eremiobacteraeota bacterium]
MLRPLRSRRRCSNSIAIFASATMLALLQLAALPPALPLDSYHSALTTLKRPAFVEFEYTQTRSGPHRIVTEQHRVYQTQDGQERNDTVMVNGTPVVPALSRILHRPVWPYDVAQFAASPDDYDFSRAAMAVVSGRKAFGFKLARKANADFMLTNLYLDARRYLPLRETFAVTGSNCSGDGIINFGPASLFWLPTSVQVTCTAQVAAVPAIFKESIRFSNYRFPSAIPADVFVTGGSSNAGAGTQNITP